MSEVRPDPMPATAALPPGFTATRCLVVACRICDDEFEHEDSGTVLHFETVDKAAAVLTEAGWWLTQDGVQCERCAASEACANLGHAWDPWSRCRCNGQIPTHRVPIEYRFCASCNASEERPAQGT